MIQCIRSSGWTGYMLVKVGMTCLRLALLKSPRDDKSSVRMLVNVAADHIVKFRQSQARVCLWWDVNGSSDDRGELAGVNRMGRQIMDRCSR